MSRIKTLDNDLIFFDLTTGQPKCSFNQCIDKFSTVKETIQLQSKLHSTQGGEYEQQKLVCAECDRVVFSDTNKKLNAAALSNAIKAAEYLRVKNTKGKAK